MCVHTRIALVALKVEPVVTSCVPDRLVCFQGVEPQPQPAAAACPRPAPIGVKHPGEAQEPRRNRDVDVAYDRPLARAISFDTGYNLPWLAYAEERSLRMGCVDQFRDLGGNHQFNRPSSP